MWPTSSLLRKFAHVKQTSRRHIEQTMRFHQDAQADNKKPSSLLRKLVPTQRDPMSPTEVGTTFVTPQWDFERCSPKKMMIMGPCV